MAEENTKKHKKKKNHEHIILHKQYIDTWLQSVTPT